MVLDKKILRGFTIYGYVGHLGHVTRTFFINFGLVIVMRLARRETGLSPPVKYFTDRSKGVLLLWIFCVIYVLCLSFFRVCSLLPCGHLKGKD